MSKNPITYRIALEIISHEAIVRQAYKDSVGVWTWSVGLTSATGHNVERYIGKPQSLKHCLEVYVWALDRYAEQVREAFFGVELTEEQFGGALSFHWNTGAIKKATWVKRFRAGNIAGAREAFMWYGKPPEILRRRKKERDLLFAGKWSNDGTCTEYTAVTSKGTPKWSSAKRINVEEELRPLFTNSDEPTVKVVARSVDHLPDPDAVTVEQKGRQRSGLMQLLLWLLSTLFGPATTN